MRNVAVKDYQTVFDIAVQEMGSVDAAFNLARINGISVTTLLQSGELLLLPEPANKYVANEYAIREYKTATADKISDQVRGGIGFMGISIDFKVS